MHGRAWMPSTDEWKGSIELDEGAVHSVGLPVGRDDLPGDERPAGLVGDPQRKGPLQRAVRVQPPDGAPRLPHRRPDPSRLTIVRPRLHEVHLRHVAVAVLVLHQDRQVVRVRPLLHVERHRQPRVLARHPLELHVDDAGVAELVVSAVLGHGAEGGAAEVEVVAGHRVVVHVGDDHRLRDAGARCVSHAPYLHATQRNNPRSISLEKQTKRQALYRHCQVTAMSATAADLVARAASLAVLEERLVAARRHGVERRQVHVLEPARATIVVRPGASGSAVPGGPGVEPAAAVDVGAGAGAGAGGGGSGGGCRRGGVSRAEYGRQKPKAAAAAIGGEEAEEGDRNGVGGGRCHRPLSLVTRCRTLIKSRGGKGRRNE
ncbi:hypothetical protein CFC21_088336 [Triticum aestivum]|uniref:Uncharacterized protein n=2 Tax=Triticum aestivum TaxID=4565 RepID=A0A3B6PNT7_WHEAT|nr:hypothetical protein CFC21_088336 [Triticum aestivum]